MARSCHVVPLILLLASGVFNPVPLISQNQAPTRDQQAMKIVQAAISNMGAVNSATAIQDCVLTGTSESDSNPDLRKEFTWTIAGNEFRFEVQSAKGTGFFVSGYGAPTNVLNGKVSTLQSYVGRANLPYYLPAFLLSKELANPNYSIQYIGGTTINGRQAIQVHLSDRSDQIASWISPQDWYFDANSTIPLRVEFRVPPNESLVKWVKGTYDFYDFRSVNGLLTPFQISFAMEHLPSQTIKFTSITFNVGVLKSIFDAPTEVGQ